MYNATISGSAIAEGNAWMEGGSLTNTANMKGNALCWSAAYSGTVVVGGDAEVGSCASGVYLQAPYFRNGRDECDGKGLTDVSNVDINATFTNFTPNQMAFSTTPNCTFVTGLEEAEDKTEAKLYPNPFNTSFQILTNGNFSFSIVDSRGIEVEKGETNSATELGSDLSKGLYLIKINQGGVEKTFKIIKE